MPRPRGRCRGWCSMAASVSAPAAPRQGVGRSRFDALRLAPGCRCCCNRCADRFPQDPAMPRHALPTLFGLSLLLASSAACAQDLYQWKDANGVTHYSQTPPASGSYTERTESGRGRSEEHTSELQSLMRISYAVFCLKKKQKK